MLNLMNGQKTVKKRTLGAMARRLPKAVELSELGVPVRQRTEKACDQCRRRKTKCDGTSQCKACIEIGLDCSYGHRLKQARGPQYIAHLESRLRILENEDENRRTFAGWNKFDGRDSSDGARNLSGQRCSEIYSRASSSSYSSGSSEFTQQDIPTHRTGDLKSGPQEHQLKRKFADDTDHTPHHHKRSASEILIDAKGILDRLSHTNHTARYAAECIQSIDENLYRCAPASPQPSYDFTLFESNNSFTLEPDAKLDTLDSKQLIADVNIDLAEGYGAGNCQFWPSTEYMNYLSSAHAW